MTIVTSRRGRGGRGRGGGGAPGMLRWKSDAVKDFDLGIVRFAGQMQKDTGTRILDAATGRDDIARAPKKCDEKCKGEKEEGPQEDRTDRVRDIKRDARRSLPARRPRRCGTTTTTEQPVTCRAGC